MAAIKNAGVGALQHIIDERNANGQFANLEDFCSRVDLRVVGKRTVESLIKVGALKSIGNRDRKQLIAALDRIISYSADRHKAKEVGQVSLFGEARTVRRRSAAQPAAGGGSQPARNAQLGEGTARPLRLQPPD